MKSSLLTALLVIGTLRAGAALPPAPLPGASRYEIRAQAEVLRAGEFARATD